MEETINTSLYPDILFHFTSKVGLFKIIVETFKVSYARERIEGISSEKEFAVPMISFCDLKLSELKERNGVKSTVDPCSKLIRVKGRLDPSGRPLWPAHDAKLRWRLISLTLACHNPYHKSTSPSKTLGTNVPYCRPFMAKTNKSI